MDEALSQGLMHIDDLRFMGDTHVALNILSSCVACQPFYFMRKIPFYSSFLSLLVGFDNKVTHVCGDMMGLGSWEYFQRPLARC